MSGKKRATLKREEVWMNASGELYLLQWGLCSRHPSDLTVTWGKGFYESVYHGTRNKSASTRKLISKGWERLEVWK